MFNALLTLAGHVLIFCVFFGPLFYIVLKLFLILIGQGHIVKKWERKNNTVNQMVATSDDYIQPPKDNTLEDIHNNPSYSSFPASRFHNTFDNKN